MFGNAVVSVNPLPASFSVTGGGNYCFGGSGVHVGLTGSVLGTNYQLFRGTTSAVGAPLPGIGASLDFGLQTTAGTYSVVATIPATGCTATMGGVTSIAVSSLPVAHNVTGSGSYCPGGTGRHVFIDGSDIGISYQLYQGVTAVSGAVLGGTGTSLDFGSQLAGSYTVVGRSSLTTCSNNMTGIATITIAPLPAVYNVTGGGNYCSSATGVHIGLSNSGTGINYQLYDGSTATGAATAGTGHTLDFGLLTGAGVYTVMATNSSTSCASNMAGSATITITPSVTPIMNITATPGTTLCAGTAVSLSSLATNGGTTPQYQWTINGANVTGATSATYSYTPSAGDVITATLTSDAQCATPASVTSNTVTMTVNPELTPVTVITASPGSPILIGETETFTATVTNGGTGATYQWKINGTAVPGATNAGYVTTNISNGDTVTCTVTSGTPCGGNTASSNKLGITVVNNVGVATHSFTEGDITVLPNPNKGTFLVQGALNLGADEEVSIEITDVLGNTVYKNKTTTTNGNLSATISFSNMPANGMYILTLHSGNIKMIMRFEIER